jgi:hypothetical protein
MNVTIKFHEWKFILHLVLDYVILNVIEIHWVVSNMKHARLRPHRRKHISPLTNTLEQSGSRDSSVGIATTLRTGQLKSRGRFPVGARFFSLLHNIQTGSGVQSAYPMGTGGCSSRAKVAGV